MKRILWEKIDDYLDGIMDEQAAIRFEQKLKNDPGLREDFTILEGVKEMLERREQRRRFLELIKHARENYYHKQQKLKHRRRIIRHILNPGLKNDTN
jgi:hypothetical protein